ncbi:hypothetical protein BH20ACT15_BH20ACT15_01770 [soil metagenome]
MWARAGIALAVATAAVALTAPAATVDFGSPVKGAGKLK